MGINGCEIRQSAVAGKEKAPGFAGAHWKAYFLALSALHFMMSGHLLLHSVVHFFVHFLQ
jgi:hypothetical protein